MEGILHYSRAPDDASVHFFFHFIYFFKFTVFFFFFFFFFGGGVLFGVSNIVELAMTYAFRLIIWVLSTDCLTCVWHLAQFFFFHDDN